MYDPKHNQTDFDDFMRGIDDILAEEDPSSVPLDTNPYRRKPEPDILYSNPGIGQPPFAPDFGEDWDEAYEDGPDGNYGAYEDERQSQPAHPPIHAYNADFSDGRPARRGAKRQTPPMDETQRYRAMEETIQRRSAPKPRKVPRPKRRRKRHGCLASLLLLAVLIAGGVLWFKSAIRPPQAKDGTLGQRKPDCATVLLAGTDAEGGRTDTMILLFLDKKNQQANFISLPRDTYTITAAGNTAKLNSAYGRNGRGEEGMEGLMDYVQDIIGYRPDGYLLVDLDCFVSLVDTMGGVNFDVPMDMFYEDASQDLFIDLKEGPQKLTGEEAMGLVRYRYGYAMADLDRVAVQRDFLSQCMDQWLSLKNITRLPKALSTVTSSATGSLSSGNMIWMALAGWKAGVSNIESVTLPGYATTIGDGSYYVLEPEEVADTINKYCNPYVRNVEVSDLNIAT